MRPGRSMGRAVYSLELHWGPPGLPSTDSYLSDQPACLLDQPKSYYITLRVLNFMTVVHISQIHKADNCGLRVNIVAVLGYSLICMHRLIIVTLVN